MTILYTNPEYKYLLETFKRPFTRTKQVQQAYERKIKTLRMGQTTPEQEILDTVLNNTDHALSVNQYPYDLMDFIEHNLFWYTKPMTDEEIVEYINSKLKRVITIFRNDKDNQSVKKVNHVHIFVDNGNI
jgi:hypothetical protein